MKVAVCGAGSNFGYAYLKRLFQLKPSYNMELIGVDVNPPHLVSGSLFCDKVVSAGYHTDHDFEGHFLELIEKEEIDYIFPLQNGEIAALQNVNTVNSPQFKIPNNFHKNKKYVIKMLNEYGIMTAYFSTNEINKNDIPILIKPLNGGGSIGVENWNKLPFDSSKFYLEKRILGTEYTVDSYYNHRSFELFLLARERIETKAGVSVKCKLHLDERFKLLAKKIGDIIGQIGCICFQVIDDGQDLYLIDLNFRCGGGTEMSRFSGFDFYDASISSLLSLKVKIPKVIENQGRYVTRQYHEILS